MNWATCQHSWDSHFCHNLYFSRIKLWLLISADRGWMDYLRLHPTDSHHLQVPLSAYFFDHWILYSNWTQFPKSKTCNSSATFFPISYIHQLRKKILDAMLDLNKWFTSVPKHYNFCSLNSGQLWYSCWISMSCRTNIRFLEMNDPTPPPISSK